MFCKKSVQEITSKWESEKPILEAEEQIRLEKETILKNKKTSTTTKRLMQYIFIDCTIIQIFTGYLMYRQLTLAETSGISIDFGPQIALISSVVAEAVSFCIYCYKSLKENSKGGIVYDKAELHDFEEDDSNLSKG